MSPCEIDLDLPSRAISIFLRRWLLARYSAALTGAVGCDRCGMAFSAEFVKQGRVHGLV